MMYSCMYTAEVLRKHTQSIGTSFLAPVMTEKLTAVPVSEVFSAALLSATR